MFLGFFCTFVVLQKLSVVIITFNEEKNIADCIKSVQSFADEILILDSFSKDGTAEIAESLGAVVKRHRFDGHIQQKNRAKNMAEHQWVLSLDADERASEAMQSKIPKILKNPKHDGYWFKRQNHYKGKWIKGCGWYPDNKLRLWKRDFGSWTGKNPHDRFKLYTNETSEYINADIIHFTYPDYVTLKKQSRKFAKISAKSNSHHSKTYLLGKLLISPISKFVKSYFVRRGFADGKDGLIISLWQTKETFLKYYWALKSK